jgi:uncharacterized protein
VALPRHRMSSHEALLKDSSPGALCRFAKANAGVLGFTTVLIVAVSVLFGALFAGTVRLPACPGSPGTIYVTRIHPHQDLLVEMEAFVLSHGLQAASVVQVTGSLLNATIRFANAENGTVLSGAHWEIVSTTGTLGASSGSHVHIALASETGAVVGGHLLQGSAVYTTAEITLVEASQLEFQRPLDPATGYGELLVACR